MKPLCVMVAMARGGAIGRKNGLPWHVPEDMQFFKTTTMGHAIIMGRATFESLGRPLPGRRNIVVSRTAGVIAGCEVAKSAEEAIALARTSDPEPMIMGGAKLYIEALPLATRLYLTEIDRDVEGADTFLHIDKTHWREVTRRKGIEPDVTFFELARMGVTT